MRGNDCQKVGAVFDFDGTLADTTWIWLAVGEQMIRERGEFYDDAWVFETEHMDSPEIAAWIKEHYRMRGAVGEILSEMHERMDRLYEECTAMKPGVFGFLGYLRRQGVPTCVASATDHVTVVAALERMGARELIDAVVTCPELDTTKREPTVYLKAAELIGCDPAHVVVFEDMLFTVTTAKNAGFYVVAIEDGVSLPHKDEIRQIADDYITSYSGADAPGSFWQQAVCSLGD